MSDDDVADEEFEGDEAADDEPDGDLDEEFGDDEELDDEGETEDGEELEEAEEEEEAAVPARRKRPGADEEEEDEEDLNPDDVEADLDTILKDRIASGDDLEDEEEEEEVPDRNDPDAAEGVAAKREGEFTCDLCFMIVHPRQFGRPPNLSCPEGYDRCPSVARLAKKK